MNNTPARSSALTGSASGDAQGTIKRRGAVAVIVRDGRLLVIRRSATVPAPFRHCFPGGGIEPSESEQQALIREIYEELRVTVEPVRRLWESVTPWGVHLAWWLGRLEPDATPICNPAEVASFHWYTGQEVLALPTLLESNRHFFAALASGEFCLDSQ